MGKSNRIRVNKAGAQVKTLGTRQKKGMPSWAINLIAILVAAVILLSAVAIFVVSNGIHTRMQTAMKTDHFTVNQNMMTYYFNAKYQNFYSTYSTYISGGNFSLDPSKDLKSQTYGDTTGGSSAMETYFLGSFEGTWFDYFMSETSAEVESMLYYCEEAKARGWELGESEKSAIDQSISSLASTATSNGYTLDAFLSANFGSGIQEQDVRAALELSELATLSMNKISEELMGEISDDRVNAAYNDTNGIDIDGEGTNVNKVDYTYYTFTVTYKDMTGDNAEAKLAAYKEAIAKAKKNAEDLEKIKDKDAFESFILPFIVEDNYDEEYDTAEKPTEGMPTADDLKTIREAMIAKVIEEIEAEVEEASKAAEEKDGAYTVYGVTVTKEVAELFNEVKDGIYSTAKLAVSNYSRDRVDYVDSDAFSTWAFDTARQAGDTYKDVKGDGADETVEITDSGATQFNATVYLLRKPFYRDTTPTRDVAYMLFSSKEDAQAAIEVLKGKDVVNQDVFDAVAHEVNPDSHDVLENYMEGDMNSTKFDNWVYGSTTAVGSFTTTPVELDSATYAVLYYVGEGEETWFMQVKNVLFNDDFEARYATFETKYKLEKKENVLNGISAVKMSASSTTTA